MRVLIVEDDKALADGLLRTLRRSGYAVDHSVTGELALRACAEEHYDLIVLDVSLPGIDGFEVLRQLRKNRETGSVLILTAHDAEPDRVRGLDLGADDYVTKPFSLPEFEARVRALIRRSQAVRSPTLRLGTLTIDSAARRAQIGGEDLDLTPREWGVLEYLLTRTGQVISKEQMLQALCSWDDSLTHNAIEVYISRLAASCRRQASGSGRCAASATWSKTRMPQPGSLQRLLARWLIGPLAGLIVLSGIPTYLTAISAAKDAYDSALLDPALAIASHLHVVDDKIEIGLPVVALDALRIDSVDRMYFQVLGPDNQRIAGNATIPLPPSEPGDRCLRPRLLRYRASQASASGSRRSACRTGTEESWCRSRRPSSSANAWSRNCCCRR